MTRLRALFGLGLSLSVLLGTLPSPLPPQVPQTSGAKRKPVPTRHTSPSNGEIVRSWGIVEDLGLRDSSSGLFGITAKSGSTSIIGETGRYYLTDVAFTPDGDLFAIDNSSLVLLDRRDGRVIRRWSLPVSANALAADKQNNLFLGGLNGLLYRINSKLTTISTVDSFGGGLIPSGDLAVAQNNRLIYGTMLWSAASDALVKISKRDGSTTVIGLIGYPAVYGLSFGPDNKLYGMAHGFSASPLVIKINTKTGHGTQVSRTSLESAGGMTAQTALSPVQGKLRVTGRENSNCVNHSTKWTFCQHQTGFHRPGGGIAGSDDTYAWDMNLSQDGDEGLPVFPVAPGVVVKYGGVTAPGGSSGAVLLEHKAGSATWYSGYLHMTDVPVVTGQRVGRRTMIGNIGDVGATDRNHLHFAIYLGENTPGGLVSIDAIFFKR